MGKVTELSKYHKSSHINERVKVVDWRGKEVARVKYNENLDYYKKGIKCFGKQGLHRGLTRLKDGRLVVIEGTDEGERRAKVVSPIVVLNHILYSGNTEILENGKYRDLKAIYEMYFDMENVSGTGGV